MSAPAFDFVIVGAGSAGCVLANRLSADGRHQVLLVEAGPEDRSRWIHLPLGLQIALRDARIEWRLASAPEPALAGRRIGHPRGRTLGGTSAMNGMIYIRGQAEDYDTWAQVHGCAGWGWRDVLPYFLRSEGNRHLAAGPWHAVDGPLAVSTPPADSALCNALIAAGRQLGLPPSDDFNGPTQEGVGYYQHTLADGRRMSAASAYLVPARGRPNLTVWTDTAAQRLCWAEPVPGGGAPRVSGVELRRGGALLQVSARREVIVAAGALHSPQLLQCSGIGDAAQLQAIGVAPRVHSPDVGRHLQDHLQVRLRYGLTQPLSLNDLYHRKMLAAGEVLQYLLGRRGRLAQPPIRAGAFCRSSSAEPRPDLQVHFIEFTSDGMGQPPHRHSGIQFSVCVLRPRSRGQVQATGPSMDQPPHICGQFFADDDDVRRSLRGVHMARRWAAQPALAQLLQAEDDPGPQVQDDAALVDWMRGNAVTVYHPVGTCRMGGDAAAVVDPQLRVRGAEGLRVVDASVMPALVSGNTNAPTIMIGEKAADLIAAAHGA